MLYAGSTAGQTLGPGQSWLSSLWLLAETKEGELGSPQTQGAQLGKAGCRGHDGKSEREERARGQKELEKEQRSGNVLFPLFSLLVILAPWTQSFRITSHNLVMILFQPLRVNKAFHFFEGKKEHSGPGF